MFLYVLVVDIKEILKLFNNTHIFDPNIFKKTFVVAPYVQGVSEKVKRVFSNYGISTCFKPHQTLRQLLVAPKDKTKVQEQAGVVYRIPCEGCNKVYVGETKENTRRTFERTYC